MSHEKNKINEEKQKLTYFGEAHIDTLFKITFIPYVRVPIIDNPHET